MPKKNQNITRYGPVSPSNVKFGGEQRFKWQSVRNSCDSSYEVPDEEVKHNVVFPAGPKNAVLGDTKNSTLGPGSYNVAKGFGFNSEFLQRPAYKFNISQRQSMVMKTPSPGAVYNLGQCYYTGPDRGLMISFSMDARRPLNNTSCINSDPVCPKLPSGRSITIGKRLDKRRKLVDNTPSYDPYKNYNFQTGPKFSFGKGKSSRFSKASILPEIYEEE